MMGKRIKVKPSKAQSRFSAVFGLIFCLIGFFVVIPTFGPFGILWTVAAAWATFISFKNGFTDEGVPTREIVIEDTDAVVSPNDIEARLTQLDSLYNKGLITRDEYDSKRKEILSDL